MQMYLTHRGKSQDSGRLQNAVGRNIFLRKQRKVGNRGDFEGSK